MRLAPGLFSSTTRSATLTLRPARIPFIRAMSDIAQFVAAAQKADPALAGAGDKEQAAIAKATSEVASIASNLKVGCLCLCLVKRIADPPVPERQAYPAHLPRRQLALHRRR